MLNRLANVCWLLSKFFERKAIEVSPNKGVNKLFIYKKGRRAEWTNAGLADYYKRWNDFKTKAE